MFETFTSRAEIIDQARFMQFLEDPTFSTAVTALENEMKFIAAGNDLPSCIHSVIYGTDTEGSARGPEYIFKDGTWEEDKLPDDPRGKS